MEQIIEELSKYEKQKDSIYKWRNNNRQKYLKYSSQYNINNYKNLDPEKKRELIEKTKANVKARRAKLKKEKLEQAKKGRPRLYE
jgi:hypothetical protein